jgi:ribonucleoside-triphosphate reductase
MSPIQTKRTACEVYSRVTGYLRPVKQWNDGKRAEYGDRKTYKVCCDKA